MIAPRTTLTRRLSGFALAAPLALALAACGDSADGDDLESDAIAAIPAPDGTTWTSTVTVTDAGGYKIGNPEAPLKLVEYASHTCGACANFAVTGKPGVKEYVETGVVSFEQREVFLNTFDVVIATLTQCGPKEQMQPLSDQVWQDLNTVMSGIQSNPQAINAAGELEMNQRFVAIGEATGLIEFFAARGLSADQARTCLADSEKIEAMVETSTAKAEEDNVTGTPTFTLNDRRLEVNQWTQLEPALQRAGARQE
ncbi:MAG: thioredoxin domain-containing protein [Pseudomonadota bacterium]